MKKWILCLATLLIIGAFDLWPFRREDAGSLAIVETLLVKTEGETISLVAGDQAGHGASVEEALEDLREHMPGQLFLRQVRRVIFCGDALWHCPPEELPEALPMSALIYHAADVPDMEKLEPVLETRESRRQDLPTLARILNGRLSGGKTVPAELEAKHADP